MNRDLWKESLKTQLYSTGTFLTSNKIPDDTLDDVIDAYADGKTIDLVIHIADRLNHRALIVLDKLVVNPDIDLYELYESQHLEWNKKHKED